MTKQKIIQLRNKTFLFIVIIIAIIGGMRTYDDLQRNNQILEKKKIQIQNEIVHNYNEHIKGIKSFITLFGQFIADSKDVQNFIKNGDRIGLYKQIEPLYHSINYNNQKVSSIHFYKANHHSFLRVHKKEKFGDNLKDLRPMISYAISTQSVISGYEHCVHDVTELTYRMVFPIFLEKDFLGVVEIGINTKMLLKLIEEKLQHMFNNNVEINYLLNENKPNTKSYNENLKSKDGYFYKSTPLMDSILDTIKSIKKQELCLKEKTYSIGLSDVSLLDYRGKKVGEYIYFVDITQDVNENKSFFYSSLAKPILATGIIILLIGWIFYYFYKNFLKLEKRTRSILDTQSSLIILSDGLNLLDCNKALLDFYGFETLEDFKKVHQCICNTFEDGKHFLQKNNDGVFWVNYLLDHKDSVIKVGINDTNNQLQIFSIVLNQYEKSLEFEDEYYVITLINISNLEKANRQLIEQSKQASLGEMIGNIAHQWRQPLSAITSIASGIALKAEFGKFDITSLSQEMDKIVSKTNYLSQTIDTFRNFINEEKQESLVVIQERINIALDIVTAALETNHIKLIKNIKKENVIVQLVVGELTQVIINLINNAKDAILENNISNGIIKIDLEDNESQIKISIEDNGGGIDANIIGKIFEPYFTTKHQSVGTGLGLYMSYKIVTESMNGKLSVENTPLGAKFTIIIPK